MNAKDVPNILTVLRIILIPIICITFLFQRELSAILFVFACITDFLDGYLARKYNAESIFGTMLDPIADKVLVTSLLILLVSFGDVQVLPVLIIIAREFIVSGLRDFSATINIKIPVSNLAKIKTSVQMLAITVLMLDSEIFSWCYMYELGQCLIWVTTLLTVITGFSYIKILVRH